MAPENPLNNTIALFLVVYFAQLGVAHYRFATGHAIQVHSAIASARIPDLVIHSEASAAAIFADGKLLRLEHPVPTLVVETVSSSDKDNASRERDYRFKRAEYAQRGIPEYWIVDPTAQCVLILTLTGKEYSERRYTSKQKLISPSFPTATLTAQQVLTAGIQD
ncbi:MAG: Uma2 family endonuclease, partial [Cyanobacteria bacterium J06649_4]